jgi:hypothetical protein
MSEVSIGDLAALIGVGIAAGWLGSLVGIGGGIVVVPVLVIALGVDFRVAVASSLVAVIATSVTAGSVYTGTGLANLRLGMVLEVATTIGAVAGGLAAILLSTRFLAGVFAGVALTTALYMLRGAYRPRTRLVEAVVSARGWEETGTLAGAYFDEFRGGLVRYRGERVQVGLAVSLAAGGISGMLGVGGGFLKVPAMNLGMNIPIKVASATSNFMIGITAAASVFVYFARGFVQPLVAAPLALGVVAGSWAGAQTAGKAHPVVVKMILVVTLLFVALQMGLRSAGVEIGG